jgi:hypothetical protein
MDFRNAQAAHSVERPEESIERDSLEEDRVSANEGQPESLPDAE